MSKPTQRLAGIVPALVTPFAANGKLDAASLERQIAHQIEAGAHGALILGLAGEGIYLTQDEREHVADVAFAAAGDDLPLLVGCTADSTEEAVALVRSAARRNAAGVMVAPPRKPGFNSDEAFAHYGAVAEAAGAVEVMVQDAPFAIGVELGVDLVLALSERYANITAFKLEALPYWDAAMRTRAVAGDRLRMFGGHAGLYLMDVIDSQAAGLIPGADVTASLVTAWKAAERGDRIAAHAVYLRLLPLLVYQAQSMGTLIGSAKTILQHRGIIATTESRHPQGILSQTSASRVLELAQQAAEV